MLLPLLLNNLLSVAGASAAITGSATESNIVGQVFGGVLTNDTLVAAGTGPIGSIANTQALIDGLVSAQSEANGFNVLRATIAVTDITRVSDTEWSLTIPASFSSYVITAAETLTWTVPAVVLTAAAELVGTPTIGIADDVSAARGGRRKRRYIVDVDGQFFTVASIAAAESVLLQIRELANESAIRDVKTAVAPKPPRISIKTLAGKKTTSVTLQREVRKTQLAVIKAYATRAREISQDIEISQLMIAKIKQEDADDENAIIALLLM